MSIASAENAIFGATRHSRVRVIIPLLEKHALFYLTNETYDVEAQTFGAYISRASAPGQFQTRRPRSRATSSNFSSRERHTLPRSLDATRLIDLADKSTINERYVRGRHIGVRVAPRTSRSIHSDNSRATRTNRIPH